MPKLDSLTDLLLHLLLDALRLIRLSLRPHCALAAENLFLRKQLALYLERKVKARRASDASRLTLVLLSSLFAWRRALTIVQPDTFIRWHRKGFRLFWRWKSKPRGRPRVPAELQKLIVEMANENPSWGEERIAAELLLKLGIRISPRTVRSYMPEDPSCRRGPSSQRWVTFVRNHAQGLLVCDFFAGVTASFRVLYVFRDHGSGNAQDRSLQRHHSSHRGLDAPAVPGDHHGRETVAVPHPRPRQHLLLRARFGPEVDGLEHLENAVPRAPGERFLRTPRRKYPPRVFGFPDSAERETPAENSQGVGGSLQPRPPTLQPGTWYSRIVGRHSGAPNFRSPYSVWSPGGRKTCSGRSASRIPTGEGGGMKSERKFRTMRFLAERTGRRQPFFRTRRYQVEGEAQTLPSRWASTASVPVGT